ncbi:hypothetical protein [Brenneria rubrifaciens]|uniref:Uncharacterized protein n=1 Tax=Brenneria rubrifaciens TaxID=55213 RepID=A0A4P8QUV7_9GAMM|nr:hypothetical protein [Brenneria rubrifaciens]QCR07925.1 hypothetical protein EH207_04955 [Brenneria rubrifaciens]
MKIPHINVNSFSFGSSQSAFGSTPKAQGTIDRINENLNKLNELKYSMSLLSTKRATQSADPIIQQLATDASGLKKQTLNATENADAILSQLKKGKLNPNHDGPHNNLIATTDTLITHWETLKESYDNYTNS